MKRVLLFTLLILLLPPADMISTDSFVEWVVIDPNKTGLPYQLIYYPNGNLVGYAIAGSYFYNSSLLYDSNKVVTNYRYAKINESLGVYTDSFSANINQVFYNPIKNDTYWVTVDYKVWKYNDTYFFNQTDLGFGEGWGMIWYNLTNVNTDIHRPSTGRTTKMVYDYENNFIMLYGGATYLADTWIFDISVGEWEQVTPLNQPGYRFGHSMVYNENDGKIYLFGGSHLTDLYNDLWIYDYLSNTWTEIKTSNTIDPRSMHGLLYDSYNHKLLFYYYNIHDLWAYDFKLKYWTFLSKSGPSASYEQLNSWIMYGNESIFMNAYDFQKLTLEMDSSPPGTEVIVTHTETVTTATTSTDYTTITTDEIPFYILGGFSVILAVLIRRKRTN